MIGLILDYSFLENNIVLVNLRLRQSFCDIYWWFFTITISKLQSPCYQFCQWEEKAQIANQETRKTRS